VALLINVILLVSFDNMAFGCYFLHMNTKGIAALSYFQAMA